MENAQIGNSDLVDIKLANAVSEQVPNQPEKKKPCCQ
jgi:hypothetical protein